MAKRKPLDPYTLRWCASALAAGVDNHALPETRVAVRDYVDHFKRCARALKPAKRTKR